MHFLTLDNAKWRVAEKSGNCMPHGSNPKVAAQVAYTCQLFYLSK